MSGGPRFLHEACHLDAKRQLKGLPTLSNVLHRIGDDTFCEDCTAALQTLLVVQETFRLYGMRLDERSTDALLREFDNLHWLSEEDLLMDLLKFKCAAMYSSLLGQELPEFPVALMGKCTSSPYLVGGRFYAFMQFMKQSSRISVDRLYSFANSLLMMKKGFPRPSPSKCEAANVKAYSTMTTPVSRTFTDLLRLEKVKARAQRVVRALFGGKKVDFGGWMLEWPSVSGHFKTNRKMDGAFGVLRQKGLLPKFERDDFVSQNVVSGREWFTSSSPLTLSEYLRTGELSSAGRVMFVREPTDRCQGEDEPEYQLRLSTAAADELVFRQQCLVDAALREPAWCYPQALPESAKVRVVTAGPVLLYAALRPLQRFLHSTVASDPRFAIAAPLTQDGLFETLGPLPTREHQWLSGDYSAATDNLACELSFWIADEIARVTEMPDAYRELLIRSLTGHYYTDAEDLDAPKTCWATDMKPFLPQARGQLMGSVTSFPILCIANFALIWESVFPTLPFKKLRIVVNGDDCLFPCTEAQRQSWREYAGSVGLTPSVGKTYFSRDWFVINSEMYTSAVREDSRGLLSFPYVPFVNMGLVTGLKRSGDREKSCQVLDERSTTIGARCTALLKGWEAFCPQMIRGMMDLFFDCNIHLFPDGEVPWFLPERWGGLGLPIAGGYAPDCLEWQLWAVSLLVDEQMREAARGERKNHRVSLRLASKRKSSPFYKEVVAALSAEFGRCWTDQSFIAGSYQWCFTDLNIPEETDDNLSAYADYWDDIASGCAGTPITVEDGILARDRILATGPIRSSPNVSLDRALPSARSEFFTVRPRHLDGSGYIDCPHVVANAASALFVPTDGSYSDELPIHYSVYTGY
jgi:hypothetical protein